jgi:hypothetical protein
MISCGSATMSDERLISVTEQMNEISDALRAVTIDQTRSGTYGEFAEAPALMSQTDATVLANVAQQRHTINAAS